MKTSYDKKYLLLALGEVAKITEKYSGVPKIDGLGEEQVSWLNERMIHFYESLKNCKGFASLKKKCRVIRNKLAHSTAELADEEREKLWRDFFDIAPNAKSELENAVTKISSENKEIRKFEKFGSSAHFGNEIERKKLTQSIADKMDSSVSESEKLSFGNSQNAKEAAKFFETRDENQKSLLDFAKNHSALNEQIQAEIVQTLQSSYENAEITNEKNPFFAENLFVQKVQNLSDSDLLENLESLKKELFKSTTGKENTADFSFYENKYAEILKQAQNDDKQNAVVERSRNNEMSILSRNLKSDLEKSLTERFTAWQLAEIDKKRRAYLEELYKKIEQFKKIEELLSPFVKNFGRLWDLSAGNFVDCGFEILKNFADLLENDAGLKELAELIGRQEAEKERYEKELRDKIELKTEFHPKSAYRGQISGLRLSGEISVALPSELAMSKNPALKLYFSQKFAEKKLLSYAYVNRQKSYREEKSTEEIEVSVKENERKGPVIICVDTSGSMNGIPEQVAKTVTFALAKKCLTEERKCFLISFSTKIEVEDLSDFEKSNGLGNLVKFLRKSFDGGTDASPALEKSLELLQTNGWKNADVLVVSDMIMGEFSVDLTAKIKAQQKKESKFYSLVIGSSGNKNVIDCFDENWAYGSTSRDAMRHLVKKLVDNF